MIEETGIGLAPSAADERYQASGQQVQYAHDNLQEVQRCRDVRLRASVAIPWGKEPSQTKPAFRFLGTNTIGASA